MTDAWAALCEAWGKPAAQHPFDRGEYEPTDGPTCWDDPAGIDLDREWTMAGPWDLDQHQPKET